MGGVYVILNRVNNKKYVGKSINVKNRWSNHISELRMNKHHNTYLQNSWNKHGEIHKPYEEGVNKYRISKRLKTSPSTVSRYLSGESNPYKVTR